MIDYEYVSLEHLEHLEHPENREIAIADPKAFLKCYNNKVIFDKVQRSPHLFSYLKGMVDERSENIWRVMPEVRQERDAAWANTQAGVKFQMKDIRFEK